MHSAREVDAYAEEELGGDLRAGAQAEAVWGE